MYVCIFTCNEYVHIYSYVKYTYDGEKNAGFLPTVMYDMIDNYITG